MRQNGWRSIGTAWLVAQIGSGTLLIIATLYEWVVLEADAFGAALLLIAVSCYVPVALEAPTDRNRLVAWAIVAGVGFGIVGAAATLFSTETGLFVFWGLGNFYIMALALCLIAARSLVKQTTPRPPHWVPQVK